jgi:predicted  nucleic acid-binding Zn-ribbon protein
MPTQSNYNHLKQELLEAKKYIDKLEKEILSYKNDIKKVSFDLKDAINTIPKEQPTKQEDR